MFNERLYNIFYLEQERPLPLTTTRIPSRFVLSETFLILTSNIYKNIVFLIIRVTYYERY
jgi:hypothetical protein